MNAEEVIAKAYETYVWAGDAITAIKLEAVSKHQAVIKETISKLDALKEETDARFEAIKAEVR